MSEISIQAGRRAERLTYQKRRESEQGSSANGSSLAGCIAAVNNLLCDTPTVETALH